MTSAAPWRSNIVRLLEAAGVRVVALDRTGGQSPYASRTSYAVACPTCGAFASVFIDERGAWSLCGHLGDPRRPLTEWGLLIRLRAA